MMLLSGGTTPMESMPVWLQYLMKVISPTPHFVVFAQDVLYRGADLSIVWPEIWPRRSSALFTSRSLYAASAALFSGDEHSGGGVDDRAIYAYAPAEILEPISKLRAGGCGLGLHAFSSPRLMALSTAAQNLSSISIRRSGR